jgi:hypothetical protein
MIVSAPACLMVLSSAQPAYSGGGTRLAEPPASAGGVGSLSFRSAGPYHRQSIGSSARAVRPIQWSACYRLLERMNPARGRNVTMPTKVALIPPASAVPTIGFPSPPMAGIKFPVPRSSRNSSIGVPGAKVFTRKSTTVTPGDGKGVADGGVSPKGAR